MGRPPALRISYVDCEVPADDDAQIDEDGKPLIGCAYPNLCA